MNGEKRKKEETMKAIYNCSYYIRQDIAAQNSFRSKLKVIWVQLILFIYDHEIRGKLKGNYTYYSYNREIILSTQRFWPYVVFMNHFI